MEIAALQSQESVLVFETFTEETALSLGLTLAAHFDYNAEDSRKLCFGDVAQFLQVMIFDPTAQKPGGNRNCQLALGAIFSVHPGKPAVKKIITQFSL